jgi:exodeoxyribonuclease V alpha subunit
MSTHLSARLVWHDRGWDGRVCDAPHLNASCIVHDHIRDSRDDEKEREAAGRALGDLNGWLPPCSRDTAAHADRGYMLTHQDPLLFRRLPSVDEEIGPYSSCPSPYRWMREESFQEICDSEGLSKRGPDREKEVGWVSEPDRQRNLLEHFWNKIEAQQSLVFYYCNHGNPLDESMARVIVGVGRVAEKGEQKYFGSKPGDSEQYPVWSRQITQDYPKQGVRIPYQEYLRAGYSTDSIICQVPQSAVWRFSYVEEHVTDDVAVAIIEQVIQSVEQVRAEGRIPGDWDRRLVWLNDVLAEVWTGRGSFPGVGSVLQYLGFEKGTAYHRAVLMPLAKQGVNIWEHVASLLEGRSEP